MKNKTEFFFSIIIPFFLCKRKDIFFLQKCLASLKAQSLEEKYYEILLINDGSSLPISKELLKFKKKFKNLKYFKFDKNKGQGPARNLGLKEAVADYILFLDADDELPKFALKKQFNCLKKKNIDIFTFNWKFKKFKTNKGLRKDFKFLKNFNNKKNILKKFLSMNFDSSVIFTVAKRELFIKNKITFPKGFHEDIPVIFQLYYHAQKIIFSNKIYYLKNKRTNSVMSNFDKKRISGYINSWNFLRKFCLKNFSTHYFNSNLKKYFIIGIKGIIAIMLIENFKLNKQWEMRRKNYFFIRKEFFKIFGNLISKKSLINNNFSKYDKISLLFTNLFLFEEKLNSLKIFDQKLKKSMI